MSNPATPLLLLAALAIIAACVAGVIDSNRHNTK